MSGEEDRQQRDLNLLMKSYKALEAEQANPESVASEPPEPTTPSNPSRGGQSHRDETDISEADVVMYRGRPVRRGSGVTPGAGSSVGRAGQFRGAGGKGRRRADGGKSGKNRSGSSRDNTDRTASRPNDPGRRSVDAERVKQALASLNDMHAEGLITDAEFDEKRRQLLDRL